MALSAARERLNGITWVIDDGVGAAHNGRRHSILRGSPSGHAATTPVPSLAHPLPRGGSGLAPPHVCRRRSAVILAHFSVLLGWFSTGHAEITMWAVSGAIAALDSRGMLERMGTGTTRMKLHLKDLWLINVCQDIDRGNLAGKLEKCGVMWDVKGGQIHHFMRDSGHKAPTDAPTAYKNSTDWIRESMDAARPWFQKAFPEKKPEPKRGFFGTVGHAIWEYNPVMLAVKTGENVVEEVEDYLGLKHLGRALHTFQDSFSPAHTLRAGAGSGVIKDIYEWDNNNKEKHDDWPGHWSYDLVSFNAYTKTLEQACTQASTDLILAVLGTLYKDEGGYRSERDQVFAKHLAKAF
jgi:hypothetical protein